MLNSILTLLELFVEKKNPFNIPNRPLYRPPPMMQLVHLQWVTGTMQQGLMRRAFVFLPSSKFGKRIFLVAAPTRFLNRNCFGILGDQMVSSAMVLSMRMSHFRRKAMAIVGNFFAAIERHGLLGHIIGQFVILII